jgi:ComF family protein
MSTSSRSTSPPRNTLTALWDWLFPPRCVACQARGAWLCAACLEQVEYLPAPGPHYTDQIAPLRAARSAAWFEGPLRQAVHHFKYEGLRVLAGVLGDILYAGWSTRPWPAQVIVPVPLHGSRLRQRGYNQSALLSQELSVRTALPVVSAVLKRITPTRPQVGLSARERSDNVRDAFRCANPQLAGARVLLIDDVWTTGATMRACGQALLAGGAEAVWGLTLAHARSVAD